MPRKLLIEQDSQRQGGDQDERHADERVDRGDPERLPEEVVSDQLAVVLQANPGGRR